jgi:hypothetical protein
MTQNSEILYKKSGIKIIQKQKKANYSDSEVQK